MRRAVLATTLAAVAGCGGTGAQASRTVAEDVRPNAAVVAWNESCARTSGDVAIDYRDAPSGAEVLFRSEGDRDPLRERVLELARYHNAGDRQVALHDLYAIPHTATVEDVEDGVRLSLEAGALADAGKLRDQVQQDVKLMQQHACEAERAQSM